MNDIVKSDCIKAGRVITAGMSALVLIASGIGWIHTESEAHAQPVKHPAFTNVSIAAPECDSDGTMSASGTYVGYDDMVVWLVQLATYDEQPQWQIVTDDGVVVQVNGRQIDGHQMNFGHAAVEHGDEFKITHRRPEDGKVVSYQLNAIPLHEGTTPAVLKEQAVLFPSELQCQEFALASN